MKKRQIRISFYDMNGDSSHAILPWKDELYTKELSFSDNCDLLISEISEDKFIKISENVFINMNRVYSISPEELSDSSVIPDAKPEQRNKHKKPFFRRSDQCNKDSESVEIKSLPFSIPPVKNIEI
jgi:hypothetical protein